MRKGMKMPVHQDGGLELVISPQQGLKKSLY